MFKKLLLVAVTLAAASGCVIYDDGPDYRPAPEPVVVNYAPTVLWADAGCYYDNAYRDDIWFFEADVDDLDGPLDVVSVWADVYDEWDGSYVASFELFPTADPYIWYSDWLGRSTYLDCFYPNYSVDIVAYDSFDDFGYTTVWADTY